jgi:methyl-accepting chemotaxis protein
VSEASAFRRSARPGIIISPCGKMSSIKSFRHWRIRTKLLSGFLTVTVLAGLVGYFGIKGIQTLDEADTYVYNSVIQPMAELTQLEAALYQNRLDLLDLILADEPARRASLQQAIALRANDIDAKALLLEGVEFPDEIESSFRDLVTAIGAYRSVREEVINLALTDDDESALVVLRGPQTVAAGDLQAAAERTAGLQVEFAREIAQRNDVLAAQAVWIMSASIAGAVLLSILFGLGIARAIGRPVGTLQTAAARVADGDLSASVSSDSLDEVGQLGRSFNTMVENIRQANEAVLDEKAGVEQKVEDAVRDAESRRQYLSESVQRILSAMDRFAKGDLTVALDVENQDEIGELFQGFNDAVCNINRMILQVSAAVESTSSAAIEISASTEQLSASTEEQSAQAGEVAAAVEQMVRTIVDNSRNATQTAAVADNNGKAARDGGLVVNQTVSKIRSIAKVVAESTMTVESLGRSSEKIGDIVQVIDDIADQTNLLALNAAIEAARAGEQGRGFAVVADEVRKLAERTTSATQEIATMIKEIQVETAAAVDAMKRGNGEVEEGILLADRAGEALHRIVGGVDQTVDMIQQIAAASEEQSSTSEQISRSVEMISSVSGESAQGVSQIAQATDGLSRQTDQLRNLVASFRTSSTPVHETQQFDEVKAQLRSGDGHSASAPRMVLSR